MKEVRCPKCEYIFLIREFNPNRNHLKKYKTQASWNCPACRQEFYEPCNICPNCNIDFRSKEFDNICKYLTDGAKCH